MILLVRFMISPSDSLRFLICLIFLYKTLNRTVEPGSERENNTVAISSAVDRVDLLLLSSSIVGILSLFRLSTTFAPLSFLGTRIATVLSGFYFSARLNHHAAVARQQMADRIRDYGSDIQ